MMCCLVVTLVVGGRSSSQVVSQTFSRRGYMLIEAHQYYLSGK